MIWRIIHWIISIVNTILCIVLICIFCPRVIHQEDLGFDYIGVIIGIITLLVSILIGWNIWNALNINSKITQIDNDINKSKLDIQNALIDIQARVKKALEEVDTNRVKAEEYMMASIDFIQGIVLLNNNDEKRILTIGKLFISAISHYIQCNEITTHIDSCLKNLRNCIESENKIKTNWDYSINLTGYHETVILIEQNTNPEYTDIQRKQFRKLIVKFEDLIKNKSHQTNQ